MPRRMLINATHGRELRIAVLDDNRLENFQVEVGEQGLERGNIFRGTIHNVQPSLNAAFIHYGADRHGFLAIQDVVPQAFYREPANPRRPAIEEVLERGKPIVVQVQKEADGQKGASLTTNLSLAGRYLVLTPFEETRGVSRKVEDEETRRRLRQHVAGLDVPPGMGVIVRTNALDQNKTTLGRDLATLLRLWKRIEVEATRGQDIRLLYSDQDLLLRALRDHLDASIDEVLVDSDAAFEKADQYMRAFLPRSKTALLRYAERPPLFERFDVEHQIEAIFERQVPLPSGGSIVIDRAEALTAIDVNSGKATRAGSQAETAVQTNAEAAAEVARQLRLRDIGGLIVVDFIDMRSSKAQRMVEKDLREAMKSDRARFTVGRISPNGLLEINRQRIQQALDRRTHEPCPVCAGLGRVPGSEMVVQHLLRRIEARAAVAPIRSVRLSVHPEIADLLRESRRDDMAELERQFGMKIEVQSVRRLQRHEHEFEWRDRPGDDPGPPAPWCETNVPPEGRWTHLAVVYAAPAASTRPGPAAHPARPAATRAAAADKEPAASPAAGGGGRRRGRGRGRARGADRRGDAALAPARKGKPERRPLPPAHERPAAGEAPETSPGPVAAEVHEGPNDGASGESSGGRRSRPRRWRGRRRRANGAGGADAGGGVGAPPPPDEGSNS